jgi:DNA-binding transcriptional ArsR family regulator
MSLPVDQNGRLARLRVVAHPLRLRILSLLTGAPMSAAELSRELGVSHALASYHLRQLAKTEFLEVAEERSHRGGREVRYRYRNEPAAGGLARGDSQDLSSLPSALGLFAEALASELRRRVTTASTSPVLPTLFTDAEVWISPEQWADLRQTLDVELRRLHDQACRPRTPGTVRVSVTAALFEMDPADGQPAGDPGDGQP